MLPETSSSRSDSIDESTDSLRSEKSFNRKILGLPDILCSSDTLIRPLLNKNQKNSEEMCLHFEGMDYICRICHGGNSSGDLLTPCKCKGTIALTHLNCLEIWLNESNRNECELCQYHFRIVREPKYSVLWSIFVFLRNPGEHFRELLVDVVTLVVYTPSTISSTYMLMLLCETLSKSSQNFRKSWAAHFMAFSAIFGIAAINFTYTAWLILTLEKYVDYWRDWYKKNCNLKVILSASKLDRNPLHSN